MMYVALSYDHRIVDGSEAVRFLVRVKELVEDPGALLRIDTRLYRPRLEADLRFWGGRSSTCRVDRILDEFERDHTGDTWHGSPVIHILRGVTATQAASRPVPHGHTIWEIVLHMAGGKTKCAAASAVRRPASPRKGIGRLWASRRRRWADARAGLDRAHADLAAAVRKLSESKVFEPTNDPPRPGNRRGRVPLHAAARPGAARCLPRGPDCDFEESVE